MTQQWKRKIAGKIVLVQSCWVDEDGDIIANVGIRDGKHVRYHKIETSPEGNIAYPYLIVYPPLGREMTFEDYDNFLNDNFKEVLELIISLLEADEIALLLTTYPELKPGRKEVPR